MKVETALIGDHPRLCVDHAGQGELLLFLHGVGGRRQNWRRQIEHFARTHHAAAWDARGYGGSEDVNGPRAFTDFADDVARLLDALGVERAHLCGLSMGGRIALVFWSLHRERVASLTLADTSAGSKETQDPARVEAFLAARRKPLLEGRTPGDLAPELVLQLIGPACSEEARAEMTASLAQLRVEPYLKTLEAVTRFNDFPDFSAIDVPVQVIVGSEDKVAPPPIARAMADAIPGARLDVIAGAGHVSNVEQPDQFNGILERFLAAQKTGERV
jgi:3-oxoadipate enol-lactonase